MKKTGALILSLLIFQPSQANLQSRWAEIQNAPAISLTELPSLTALESNVLKEYSFLLIDGVLGDLTASLYNSILDDINRSVPESDLQVLRPSSFFGIQENAQWIIEEISQRNKPKPLIIVAHSRGALELFVALLSKPEMFEEFKIAKVILVQGAFSGSPLADWLERLQANQCDSQFSFWIQLLCTSSKVFQSSLEGLTTERATHLRSYWQENLNPANKNLFKDRVFFVRSHSSFHNTSQALIPGKLFLSYKYFDLENDGVLLTSEQKIPGLGMDLGVLDSDHLTLLGASAQDGYKSALFFRSLLSLVVADNP